jgi:hypothetical protein
VRTGLIYSVYVRNHAWNTQLNVSNMNASPHLQANNQQPSPQETSTSGSSESVPTGLGQPEKLAFNILS